jgi:glycosyltransferase involved in cell wall biosynthesis
MARLSNEVCRCCPRTAGEYARDRQLFLLCGPEVVKEIMHPNMLFHGVNGTGGRVHVVHLIEALGPGGAERVLFTNLRHLDTNRIRSTVVTVFSKADHWAPSIRSLGIPVISLACRGYTDVPRGMTRFYKQLKTLRPNLLHTHLWTAGIIGRSVGRLVRVPVISSVHNPDYEDAALRDYPGPAMEKWIVRSLDKWTAKLGCDRMLAVSEHVRKSTALKLGMSLQRISLLYNPVDYSKEETPMPVRDSVLSELGLPLDSMLLLNVARVSPQKGLVFAIRALPVIAERFPLVHLLSVGVLSDDLLLNKLHNEATRLGVEKRVHYLGPRSDVWRLLRAADVFVFPSLYEGLGVALIEAMRAGCACVATSIEPVLEFMRHDAEGVLVPPADPHKLADAVSGLLADNARRQRLGRAAKDQALRRFHPDAIASRLASIYEEVLAAPRGGSGENLSMFGASGPCQEREAPADARLYKPQ